MIRATTLITIVLYACSSSNATIIGVAGGPLVTPPTTLGPYTMTPFPEDTRDQLSVISDAPSPFGDPLIFSRPMLLARQDASAGGPWIGYDYVGAVYVSATPSPFPTGLVELTLPAETRAFYLYASNNFFSGRFMRVTADDGTTVRQFSFVGSPDYYGFYQDDPAGPPLRSLRISVELGGDAPLVFVGQFGIAIPEPATLMLLALGALAARRRW